LAPSGLNGRRGQLLWQQLLLLLLLVMEIGNKVWGGRRRLLVLQFEFLKELGLSFCGIVRLKIPSFPQKISQKQASLVRPWLKFHLLFLSRKLSKNVKRRTKVVFLLRNARLSACARHISRRS
jgi:hypothetical protein